MRTKKLGSVESEVEAQAFGIMRDFFGFTGGTRYLTLLHRGKDGGSTNEYKRRGGYFVVHDETEYYEALVRLLTLKAVSSKPYRLYASANARNLQKGERAFKRAMLEVDFEDGENKRWFFERLPSKWVSALMEPGSRQGNGFLLDVDGEGDINAPVLQWLASHNIEPVKQYKTPNGWHILTPPFNPTEFDVPNCEIKKDGLLLLAS